MAKVILTGATGFVGKALAESLIKSGHEVIALVRTVSTALNPSIKQIQFDLTIIDRLNIKSFDTGAILIHAAARAHVMHDSSIDPLFEYRKVNRDATIELAKLASRSGARRFIYLSSIKVNGEQTTCGGVCKAEDLPTPKDAYGISKYEAEQGLLEIAANTRLEVVIIRPPLVYGPGVKGNFYSMMQVVKKGFPLPLGAVNNERSLVALDNLIDLIITCIDHPAAASQVFLASDGEDLSTTELLRGVAKAAGVSSRLIPVPVSVLMFMASLLGKKEIAQRILGSLQVDISKTRDLLGWTPPLTVEEGLRRCFVRNA